MGGKNRDGNREPVPVENRLQIVIRSIGMVCHGGYRFLLLIRACFSDSCALQKFMCHDAELSVLRQTLLPSLTD